MQAVEAIKRILYAADDDASVIAEAQALVSGQHQQDEAPLASIPEEDGEDTLKVDTQKRKTILNVDVDTAANNTLSPRQRISDASDVHCSGSPLVTY